jgi:hypothetical protein
MPGTQTAADGVVGCCCYRYDGLWHQGSPRCGTYSEIQPAPPGAPGSIPNIELSDPDQILHEAAAAAAAAGAKMALAAAETAAAALVGLGGSYQDWQQQQHTACTVTASGTTQTERQGVCGLFDSHPGYIY